MAKKKRTKPAPSKPVSIRQLAAELGVEPSAVSRGIKRGRLGAAVAFDDDGTPVIKNPQLAKVEWHASRRPRADDGDADEKLVDENGDPVPPYRLSRAKREASLAEIAAVEARRLSGGEWFPRVHVEKLEAQHLSNIQQWVRLLRRMIPVAIMRRCDLQTLAKRCTEHNRRLKHFCRPSEENPQFCDEPLPYTDEGGAFRLAMFEVQNAVVDTLNEIADSPQLFDEGDTE